MDLADQIVARVKSAKAWDPNADISNFQFRVTQHAVYLVSLTSGVALIIPDDGSEPFEWPGSIYG